MLNISILDDLSTFEYIEITMMFWSMNIIGKVWNELYGFVLWLRVLNIVIGVWEIGVVTCLWILAVLS
jgi:hypothetical protein